MLDFPAAKPPSEEAQLVRFTPSMRRLIADAIEAMIILLDEIDGDADLEDDDPAEENGDAEPSLGATHSIDQRIARRASQIDVVDGEQFSEAAGQALSRDRGCEIHQDSESSTPNVVACGFAHQFRRLFSVVA